MDSVRPAVREIFLSAGEPSGDLHASELVHRLKSSLPGTVFTCLGGPALAGAGASVLVDNRELAVVGIFEVLRHTRVIADALRRIRQYLTQVRPNLVILVDFPDFNFLLMRMAKRLGIPVFYYISPQVWAWRRGRVRTLKRLTDDMAVILPFEVDFYRRHGMKVHYVGHPLLDVMQGAPSREEAWKRYRTVADRPLVGLLPGSRRGEIRTLLPVLMDAAVRIAGRRPDVDFILPLAPSLDPEMIDQLVEGWSVPLRRVSGDTYGVIRACDFILTASGTVTLEAAILGTPMIITYKLSNLTYHVGKHLAKVDRAGLPNLIADELIVPELLQKDATPERLAEAALRYLDDPTELQRQRTDLAEIRKHLGEPGVVDRTAQLVLRRLGVAAVGDGAVDRPARNTGNAHLFPIPASSGMTKAAEAHDVEQPSGGIFPAWVMAVYGLGWSLLWPAGALYYTLRSAIDGKYAESHQQRLGLHQPDVKGKGNPIWIHALSVGETLSVAPLVRALRERLPETDIVFSTATETGQRLARKTLPKWIQSFFYLPHDLPLVTDHWVRRIQPRLFILVETDLWPNLLFSLDRRGIPTVLVNGRLSRRSFERMFKLRGLWRPVLNSFRTVFAQSETDREHYIRLGAHPSRVRVTGNLKVDAVPDELSPAEVAGLKDSIRLSEGRLVWLAGSTHEGEEEVLLRIHNDLRRQYRDLLLILAPRNPGRAPQIAGLCNRAGLQVSFRSTGQSAEDKAVFLLDTLGELGRFYAAADVAFIGGSWVPFGGHNPLEAAAQGKPACWGPHLFNFREVESALLDTGCFKSVSSEEELGGFLRTYLAEPALRGEASERTVQFLKSHRGAVQRLVRHLLLVMEKTPGSLSS